MLLRAPAARRALLQLPTQSSKASFNRPAFTAAAVPKTTTQLQSVSHLCTNAFQTSRSQPHVLLRGSLASRPDLFRVSGQTRFQTKFDKPDLKAEEKLLHKTLKATPESVSSGSTVHPVFGEHGGEQEPEVDMMAGVKGDIVRDLM